MAKFWEEILRETKIGTFKYMGPAEQPKYDFKDQSRGLGKRMSPDIMWRVSTRHEMVGHFHDIAKAAYKNLAIALLSLVAGFRVFRDCIRNDGFKALH